MPWQPLPDDEAPPPAPVGRALEAVLRDLRAPAPSTVRSVFDSWTEVVGESIARNATPVSLQDGRLVLGVTDPAWATQLRFLERELLAKLGDAFGPGEVTAIDVRVRRPGR